MENQCCYEKIDYKIRNSKKNNNKRFQFADSLNFLYFFLKRLKKIT